MKTCWEKAKIDAVIATSPAPSCNMYLDWFLS